MDLRDLRRKNLELGILNSIAQDLNREVALDKALNATLEQTVKLMELETGWIWLFDPDSNTARVAATFNLPPALLQNPDSMKGWCYCIEKYLTGQLEMPSNISEITCTRLKDLVEGTAGLRFHATVPLISRSGKIGLMNVVSPEMQELSEDKLRLLYTIGDMLAIAIERARLFENSQKAGRVQERNRLAREIHDSLAQGLSAISLKLEALEALLESGAASEKVRDLARQSLELTRYNLEEARRSVLDLRVTPLQDNDLGQALDQLLNAFLETTPLIGSVVIEGSPKPLPVRMETGLYRMAQEALENVRKHARASKLTLVISYAPDSVTLAIEDDGVGFNPDAPSGDGFGLTGLQERARLLQGKLQIRSQPGQGTRITVFLPITH